ncbi:MAG TPA: hypothetical protein VJ742_12110 [Nitrososphaera sp.]|nr:hypothetical protein [Nitrososphaera sp.]
MSVTYYPNTLNEISKFIFTSKYARYREDLERRETWEEAVERVESMHLSRFSHLDGKYLYEIMRAFDVVREQRAVPSMRSMQFGGAAVEASNARLYNCSVRHVDSIRAFAEVFFLLLCGCGVGLGLTHKYLSRLPDLVGPDRRTGTVITYVVEDTIEGWADSLEALLNCYFVNTAYSGRKMVFDYSRIRPKGSPLKVGGGKAPGFEPLKNAHIRIKKLLDHIIEDRGQQRMRSIDAYDIIMHAADAVLSGGVRRSATSVVFDKDDEDMLYAKSGNWMAENPQRGRSNNSVLLVRNNVSMEEFRRIVERTREWGEPGFVFADSEDVLYNPCFEVSFIPVTDDGVCGVQFCNLTSINGSKVETEEDFYRAVEAAALIGTLQADYTDFPYLSQTAEQLTSEEALLGVSMTAMMDNPDVLLDPTIQRKGAQLVLETNKKWAAILGIKPAARATVVKPEGTSTLALGSVANGIHAAHAHVMFRRIQTNRMDPVYQFFRMYNPHLCENSVYSANDTDDVVTFPVIVPDKSKVKADLDALTHLEIIKSTQENWVIPGTSESNKKNVYHNVSCTVIVRDDEWENTINYLYFNRAFFSAVSLLPDGSDKAYPQAPFEAVTTEEDKEKFDYYMLNFLPLDYSLMLEKEDGTELMQEVACAGPVGCEVR